MINIWSTYESSLKELIDFIDFIEQKIISSDEIYLSQEKFYKKSFLISGSIYLETYLKDIGYKITDHWRSQISLLKIPRNLIEIKYDKKVKGLNEDFTLSFGYSDVDDMISGNVGKTVSFFEMIGVSLNESKKFNAHKDIIARFIEHRNNVIHHNLNTNFISLGDIKNWLGKDFGFMDRQYMIQWKTNTN